MPPVSRAQRGNSGFLDESAYRIEARSLRADAGGYRGAFKVFVARGAALVLMHEDVGGESPDFVTAPEAVKDATARAHAWLESRGLEKGKPSARDD